MICNLCFGMVKRWLVIIVNKIVILGYDKLIFLEFCDSVFYVKDNFVFK